MNVRMAEATRDSEKWPLSQRSGKPILKRTEKYWNVSTYSRDKFALAAALPKVRLAMWVVNGYRCYFSYDSLVREIRDAGHGSEVSKLVQGDTVSVPEGFLAEFTILNDLAISLIHKKAFIITDPHQQVNEFIEIRQVTATYRARNPRGGHSTWAGLEFWITGSKAPMFTDVQIVT